MDDDPDFYKDALGICYAIPSAETNELVLELAIGLGKNNVWREVYQQVYYAFRDFAI